MAPKGGARDMNAWRATLREPNVTFPGESSAAYPSLDYE